MFQRKRPDDTRLETSTTTTTTITTTTTADRTNAAVVLRIFNRKRVF